jgi:phosphopantothenoylcysteine synthetase/decarboxylase
MLADKHIALGITGGISVYKMCTVVRLLKKAGAHVRVIMTQSATEFVSPLSRRSDRFALASEQTFIHIPRRKTRRYRTVG